MQSLPTAESLAPQTRLAQDLVAGLERVILGQGELVRLVVTGLIAGGHVLLEGLPGLGKTELVKGLAALTGCTFTRVQFTPDLLPSDITGTTILEESSDGRRVATFRSGPVFTQVLLADEINRASPKTQSALLEAMQERQTTVLGTTHKLPEPFFVLATQNPIELDGTYPLPEAQLDRFLIKATVSGIGDATLARILMERPSGAAPVMTPVCDPARLRALVAAARGLPVPEALARYIARLVNATRPELPEASERVKALVRWGASPRAALALAACARARALMDGRPAPGFDDVKAAVVPVMAHRIIPAYEAGLQGVDAPTLVREVMAVVPELA